VGYAAARKCSRERIWHTNHQFVIHTSTLQGDCILHSQVYHNIFFFFLFTHTLVSHHRIRRLSDLESSNDRTMYIQSNIEANGKTGCHRITWLHFCWSAHGRDCVFFVKLPEMKKKKKKGIILCNELRCLRSVAAHPLADTLHFATGDVNGVPVKRGKRQKLCRMKLKRNNEHDRKQWKYMDLKDTIILG
jgi:hypothetical protein